MFNEAVSINEEVVEVEVVEAIEAIESIESKLRNVELPKSEPTKKDLALDLWRVAVEKKIELKRKEWIAIFVKEVNLTEAGAKTYYQKMKSGEWA